MPDLRCLSPPSRSSGPSPANQHAQGSLFEYARPEGTLGRPEEQTVSSSSTSSSFRLRISTGAAGQAEDQPPRTWSAQAQPGACPLPTDFQPTLGMEGLMYFCCLPGLLECTSPGGSASSCFRLENDARTSAHPPLAWSMTDSIPFLSPFVKCRKRKLKFVLLHLLSSS